MKRRAAFPVAIAGALAAGLALAGPGRAAPPADGLKASGAWMRFLLPDRPVGGYFTLANQGDMPRMLVGAASPACGMVMLHKSDTSGGMDTMAMVPSVMVPAHGSVRFAPGGYHLMCDNPAAALRPGRTVTITLKFQDGAALDVPFAVRNAAGK